MEKTSPLRAFPIGALALALAACNQATSQTPLFGSGDAAGAPRLKDGVWRIADPRCRFRQSKPVNHWPKCAEFGDVRGTELLIQNPGVVEGWSSRPFLISGGPMMVAQVEGGGPTMRRYTYFGVRVAKTDRSGQAVELRLWPVLCGPPPRGAALPQNAMVGRLTVTDAPFPGLAMSDEDEDCQALDAATIRAAARQSEPLVAPIVARWTIYRPLVSGA